MIKITKEFTLPVLQTGLSLKPKPFSILNHKPGPSPTFLARKGKLFGPKVKFTECFKICTTAGCVVFVT